MCGFLLWCFFIRSLSFVLLGPILKKYVLAIIEVKPYEITLFGTLFVENFKEKYTSEKNELY